MPRKSKPWWRKGRGWYATINNSQLPLGVTDPNAIAAALAALNALISKPAALPVDWRARVEEFGRTGERRGCCPKTLSGYRKYLAHFVARFGTDGASRVTAESVEASASVPTWGPNTRRNYLATVEAFLKWHGHPVALNKPGRESAGANVCISEAVFNQALGAARGELRPLLAFLWHTGCRPSEAYRLTANDVDWLSGTITFRKHKTARRSKGKPRVVYLSPAAREVLEQQRAKHPAPELLFPNRAGNPWTEKVLAKALWRLSKRVGHRVTAYGFRHGYATRALEKGIPDTHVAALLGHGSTRMIHAHYSHLSANARLLKETAARV
jgi:integrase